ncbi:hypothetical protein D3C80_1242450 [compost metagenome]
MSAPASAAFMTSYPPASMIFRSASTVSAGKASLIALTACNPSLMTIGVPISTTSINSATSETISLAPAISTRSSANCNFIYKCSFSIYFCKCCTKCKFMHPKKEVGTFPYCSYPEDTIGLYMAPNSGSSERKTYKYFTIFVKYCNFIKAVLTYTGFEIKLNDQQSFKEVHR